MRFFILFSIACVWLFNADLSHADETPGVQTTAKLDTRVAVTMDYLLYLPPDYDKQPRWPLMLFLHGSGERGNDLDLVKRHGPPKLIAAGKHFPFIVVSPQCPEGKWWEPFALLALIKDIQSRLKVDADRIYVTGISMGGHGTWMLAAYAPDQIAAVAPICGGGNPGWAELFAHMPVWAFHGAKDNDVSPQRSREMVDALRKNGGDPKLTVYPDKGHDAWTVTYDDPELYEWLLRQQRMK